MVKLALMLISLLALSACETLSPAEQARRDRAKTIALAYLQKYRKEIPPDAKIRVGIGTYEAEVEPPRHFYGVEVSVPLQKRTRFNSDIIYDPQDPRREFLYSVWVDPRDWTVEFFSDILRRRQ
jgi:hypothetical protein